MVPTPLGEVTIGKLGPVSCAAGHGETGIRHRRAVTATDDRAIVVPSGLVWNVWTGIRPSCCRVMAQVLGPGWSTSPTGPNGPAHRTSGDCRPTVKVANPAARTFSW